MSTAGSISFSSYLLRAITKQSHNGSWLNRGIAVAAISGRGSPISFPLSPFFFFFSHPPSNSSIWEYRANRLTVVCLIHSFTPRLGIWLSNGLGALKLILLLLLVCTGFAALSGKTVAPRPNNFSIFDGAGPETDLDDTSTVAAAGYALALLQVW